MVNYIKKYNFSNTPNNTDLFDIETFNLILGTIASIGYPILNATSKSITYLNGDVWVLTPNGITENQSTGEIKEGEV